MKNKIIPIVALICVTIVLVTVINSNKNTSVNSQQNVFQKIEITKKLANRKLSWNFTAEYIYMIAQIDVVTEVVDTGLGYSGDITSYAYVEGKGDANVGDIRIEKIGEDWKWIKSPWDGGSHAIFNRFSEYNKYLIEKRYND